VAIGASAGGLEPLKILVGAIPPDVGVAWIVVQHLSPCHDTILHELLDVCTELPVKLLEHDEPIVPDRIVVAPPGYAVHIEGMRYTLEAINETGVRTPIDTCFTSLAAALGERAFCVILSGTGSDGTAGLRQIKTAGGIAFTQTARDARFPGMPDSARATGLVDYSLRPVDIPLRITEIVEHRAVLEDSGLIDRRKSEIEASLPAVLDALRANESGHDFTTYKPGTLVRRIERRMMLTRHRSVQGFLQTLECDDEERARLIQDFMIGVTRFFRDPEAFDALRLQVLANLAVHDPERARQIRIWVAGCSTGEEVYSIAMTMLGLLEETGSNATLQVFGTDIDAAALYQARQGSYPTASVEGVPDLLRKRWFVHHRDQLRATSLLRDCCVFARHDLISDPPFSHVDLISCRNLMIYLNGDAQRDVFHRLHYALNPEGALFLGSSETTSRTRELFHEIDSRYRLYRRDDDAHNSYSTLPVGRMPSVSISSRPPGVASRSALASHEDRPPADSARTPAARSTVPPLELRIERYFLRRAAPAFAAIDTRNHVVYMSEAMTRHVQPVAGTVSMELDALMSLQLARPARRLVNEVRQEAAAGKPGAICSLEVRLDAPLSSVRPDALGVHEARVIDETTLVRLRAHRMPEERDCVLLVIEPLDQPERLPSATGGGGDLQVETLEQELSRLRRDLDIALLENDNSQQDLRATNEQLLSMNVEMQSANEELETSREELQSINEELQTMNSELNENNQQLKRAHDDLKNLFEASETPTLFLDANLLVRGFTPQLQSLFAIRDADIGRPLTEVNARFSLDTIEADADEVFRTLKSCDREIEIDVTGEVFILRIRPYRTVDDRLEGLVMTFFDMSALVRQQRQLAENADDLERQYAELEILYDTTPVGLSLVDRELRWLRVNTELATIHGFDVEEHIGKRQDELVPDIDMNIAHLQRQVFATGETIRDLEVHGTTPAEPGSARDWIIDLYPVTAGDEVFAVGICVREVTGQKALQRDLQAYVDRLRMAVSIHPIHFHEIDEEGRLRFALSGHPVLPGEVDRGASLLEWLPEPARETVRAGLEQALVKGSGHRIDVELEQDGRVHTYDLSIEPSHVVEPSGSVPGSEVHEPADPGALLVWLDVTERKANESRAMLLLAELQHRVKNTLATVLAIVRFMARSATSVEAMRDELTDRLQAIARTHDLLTETDWQTTSIRELIELELAPYAERLPDVLECVGPAVNLRPREALALGMAIHELVTNSVKHGALSMGGGRITVTTGRSDRRIRLTWAERGVARRTVPPEHHGFGRFLLEQALPTQIEGTSELAFTPGEVHFSIEFPAYPLEGRIDAALAAAPDRDVR